MSTAGILAIGASPFVVIGTALAIVTLINRRRQFSATREFARRYADAGVHYTPLSEGFGTSDGDWMDRVHGLRHGRPFTAFTESRAAGAAQYSADDSPEGNDVLVHRSSVPLTRDTPALWIWTRARLEDESHFALYSDQNAGAVATGFAEFDEHFLVFCDDLSFVREVMTRELVSCVLAHPMSRTYARGRSIEIAPRKRKIVRAGIELRGGELSLEEITGRLDPDRVFAGVDYLNELLTRLPAELVPERQHADAREGQR